jgi:6-phosphogluconolactonase (cycloisomerase 2 family)
MPRAHDVIPDPTGRYVLVPDLGADSVRVFQTSYEPDMLRKLFEIAQLKLIPGPGPRHGVSVEIGGQIYFYALSQISNTLVGFKMAYLNDKALEFLQVSEINLLLRMDGSIIQRAAIASELQVSV